MAPMQTGGIHLMTCAAVAAAITFPASSLQTSAPAPTVPRAAPAVPVLTASVVPAPTAALTASAALTVPAASAAPAVSAVPVSAGRPAPAVPVAGPAVPVSAWDARDSAPAAPGRAVFLYEPGTGTVHLSKQAARRMPVASLTKVMAAYVVLREARLDDTVTITAADVKHAARNGATHASLRAGERLTVRDLLYGVMLPSGADASHALARVYGPGNARFVAKMNTMARSLGLTDTSYANADGLPKPKPGYSTATDQAKLAEIALRDPTMRIISATRRHVVPKTKLHRAHVWTNSNKLLGKTPGALGVKTGYTDAAGYCLSFAADRDGRRIVGVILGESKSERRFQTATRLLDWAEELAPVPAV
ncbi:D-alanyl-D-alanine carboxypeptidase (penicillin-binding protein 5/6) [Streptosporangium becharense]|uniref:D-alanyl-D-alanine carboxypeptidase (Penicillin-binding protein 5/6) n=1 Tax=Streptosporangium becharense TaxID=1816182 RepID=A0A7W9MIR4_9ACTN|nr:serine hydrolase [Streptosporangium becharense]MBB2911139.1 D-alanyl-D-alanine carboxypeptidase (penicillin-binding protein 5/6) [Streptosporangium becharense]MBB5821803.1 D-alanyl-D-alanine carboxypeptidase (penicillin-binding protein 5/6) [Streptosporangium becharense]